MTAADPGGCPSGAARPNLFPTDLWQRRYWEYLILDERDFAKHVDYIHDNPVKHGLVKYVKDWPYSTFHRYVKGGVYPHPWSSDGVMVQEAGFGEYQI